ncbi:MAG: glucose-6-phosphate dehydrogenase [Desulfoplanes sp.]
MLEKNPAAMPSEQPPVQGANNDCMLDPVTEPMILVIFGATGDLTARKVFPAIYNLLHTKSLPDFFLVLGVGRSPLTSSAFRKKMHQCIANNTEDTPDVWDRIVPNISYFQLAYDNPEDYKKLKQYIKKIDPKGQSRGNILFYLAVPPANYPDIAAHLGEAGFSREHSDDNGHIRLVVEKPFGRDLKSARNLDATLHVWFSEPQIFRIDHYMAKETVQNVLMFRFANALFEPIWNRSYIDYIQITAAETLGVEHRAGYYEQAGVLRDMFQNHMMMLLALCAMEPPSLFESERVRDERSKVYRALQPFPINKISERLVLGQYAAGSINGKPVGSYTEEPGISPASLTPTYARMKVFIDNWRWQGVPFYITSGKRMAEKRTEIIIQFKEIPCSMFHHLWGDHITANRLVLSIYPRESVELTIQAKTPGAKVCLRPVTMHVDYAQGHKGQLRDGYEKILLDCMLGDQTLFWRQDAVELCWGFLTPILEECDCPERKKQIHLYPAGTNGPQEAERLQNPGQ